MRVNSHAASVPSRIISHLICGTIPDSSHPAGSRPHRRAGSKTPPALGPAPPQSQPGARARISDAVAGAPVPPLDPGCAGIPATRRSRSLTLRGRPSRRRTGHGLCRGRCQRETGDLRRFRCALHAVVGLAVGDVTPRIGLSVSASRMLVAAMTA